MLQPAEIALADFHWLPQQPVFKNGKKENRPIIIKITNSSEKHFIYSSLKYLKPYNSKRKLQSLQPHYWASAETFARRNKITVPIYKAARLQKKTTMWRAEKGHYKLYVDNAKVELS